MVSLAILTVVMLGFSYGLLSTTSLSNANRENARAREASRRVIEDLQNGDFAEVFARYNADPEDDPGGPGTAPGPFFEVQGLTPRPDDADGFVGEILFPVDDVDALREDLEELRLGTPRDLNADGIVDGFDHSNDYRLLPVLVRSSWRGASGDAQLEVVTFLADR